MFPSENSVYWLYTDIFRHAHNVSIGKLSVLIHRHLPPCTCFHRETRYTDYTSAYSTMHIMFPSANSVYWLYICISRHKHNVSIAPFLLITTRETSESLMSRSATQLSERRYYTYASTHEMVYGYPGLCVSVLCRSHTSDFHVLTLTASLCSKIVMWRIKMQFTALTERGENVKKVMRRIRKRNTETETLRH